MIELKAEDHPAHSLSLVAGLALIEACDIAFPGLPLVLKWPNDLLLAGSKMAGILLERLGDRVVAGFGVNLAEGPELEDRNTAAIGTAMEPTAFAPVLAGSFARMLGLWRSSDPDRFAQAWLARAHPVGTELTVHTSSRARLCGTFDGIEPDGALRLRHSGTVELIRAGDVELGA